MVFYGEILVVMTCARIEVNCFLARRNGGIVVELCNRPGDCSGLHFEILVLNVLATMTSPVLMSVVTKVSSA